MTKQCAVVVLVLTLALLGAIGCKSSDSAQPAASSNAGSGSRGETSDRSSADAGTSPQARLMTVLRDYQLPAQSVPAGRHADPQVDGVIQKMMAAAAQQGLTFDGSRATAEGIVVVGRTGKSGKPMLVAVAVYSKAGRVAMQDTSKSNGLDYADAEKMKERYLNVL